MSNRPLQSQSHDQAAVTGVGDFQAAPHALQRLLDDGQPQATAGGGGAGAAVGAEIGDDIDWERMNASAVALFLFVILLILTLIQMRGEKKVFY